MNSGNSSTSSDSEKSIFISAGEQSGDLHASGLIKELRAQSSGTNLKVSGIGGSMMKNEGAELLYDIKDLSTIGFLDVVKKYGFFTKVLKECSKFIEETKPSMIILIDYPGFNIRLAKEARKFYTNKIVYYISPQLWAWHKKRVYAIKKYVNKMLVVFPFEKKFYESYGIDAEYVGHPLVKRIDSFLSENSAQSSGSSGKKKVITMLPGSRRDEIKYHLPALIKTGLILKKEFNAEINISIVSGIDGNVFEKYKVSLEGFNLVRDNIYQYIRNSDLVLTKAGTSTIECSLIGTPFLIFYRTSPINYYLLKPIVKVDKLGMVNILADKIIVKEFIQNDFTVSNLVEEARKILNDEIYRNTMCTNLEKIRQMLGSRDASNNAAKIITSLINQN